MTIVTRPFANCSVTYASARPVSFAMDREGISQSILRGPFLRGWAGGLFPGSSSYFDRSTVAYFNQQTLRLRCSTSCLTWVSRTADGDGTLNWPTDRLASGENLVLALITSEDAEETQTVGDAAVTLLGDLGVQINVRPLNSAARRELIEAGEWEMRVDRDSQSLSLFRSLDARDLAT